MPTVWQLWCLTRCAARLGLSDHEIYERISTILEACTYRECGRCRARIYNHARESCGSGHKIECDGDGLGW